MKRAVLDFSGCQYLNELHERIQVALEFPDYYGKNLDALYDCLTEIGIETEIQLINKDFVSNDLLNTFIDAEKENTYLKLSGFVKTEDS